MALTKMPLKILAKNPREAEVYVYDEIGEYWGEGISAKDFVREINALKVDVIHLHINSPGGNVFDGSTMYNALRQHKGRVVVHVDGLAASAASLLAMSGDEIQISGNAFFMIHNPWTIAAGDAAAFRKAAGELDLLSEVYAKTYAGRTGRKSSYEEIVRLMDSETWMNADMALSLGFADSITEPLDIAAKFDFSRYKYKNVPEATKEQSVLPPELARRARLASMDMTVTRIQTAPANRQSTTARR